MPPKIGATAADLGFAAFAERNRPRYLRYARARLSAEVSSSTLVGTTLVFAKEGWGWLLSQPNPAAEVWEDLRFRVGRLAGRSVRQDPALAALYERLPDGSADSVVLCCRLGFLVGDAAELMGTEPPAVEVALAVARRTLPHLIDREVPLTRP